MRFRVIGDSLTILGFSLAGATGVVVTDVDGAEKAISEALGDPDAGILIITERVADLIRARADELLFSDRFPLVLEIPDSGGAIPGRPTMKELVKQAIGIAV